MVAAIAAFLVTLFSFKDLILRAIIIGIGIGLMITMGSMMFGFVGEIGDFVDVNKSTVPSLGGIELANSIVPLSECVNLIVSLLILRVSLSVVSVGFTIHRFIWRIVAHSD